MKAKLISLSLLAFVMFCTAAFTSCSKDDDMLPEPEEETFDIHNPEGYFLYVKQSRADGSRSSSLLFEFMPGEKKLRVISVFATYRTFEYTVIDKSMIELSNGYRFIFEGNSVSSSEVTYREIVLIKASESDQLIGKTFSGTYYKSDKSVLHQNFFYRFASGRLVHAGFNPAATERIESYTAIGNFAARVELGNYDTELMVLVNGKLEVTYYAAAAANSYYGTFTQQ